jgi:hypothetical protein
MGITARFYAADGNIDVSEFTDAQIRDNWRNFGLRPFDEEVRSLRVSEE